MKPMIQIGRTAVQAVLLFAVTACGNVGTQGSGPQLGVHLGAGCDARRDTPRFERFAGAKVERVVDALNQKDWPSLDSSITWISNCWKGAPQKLTLSLPMLTFQGGGTLRDGARGAFDAVHLKIARTLIADGRPDATIRIGWEFNGDWMPWRASQDPAAFIAYYRRIVRLMRSVPGQRFQFEWTTGIGKHAMAPDLAYPGDDVVDIISSDVYNEYWSKALTDARVRFTWLLKQSYGMEWLRDFARKHSKPTAYPEWGSGTRPDGHGAGDDPYFFQQMAAWFVATKPLYQSYWEVRNATYDDTISQGTHPLSAAAYRTYVAPLNSVSTGP